MPFLHHEKYKILYTSILKVGVNEKATVANYDSDTDDEAEKLDTQKLVQKQNRKNKKSGGFQVMGLSPIIYCFVL